MCSVLAPAKDGRCRQRSSDVFLGCCIAYCDFALSKIVSCWLFSLQRACDLLKMLTVAEHKMVVIYKDVNSTKCSFLTCTRSKTQCDLFKFYSKSNVEELR